MTVARILATKGHDVITTQPTRTLQDVANLLSEKHIGAVVVTNPDRDVVGIVSERDIVRAVAKGGAKALLDPVSAHMTTKVVTAGPTSTIHSLMEAMTEGRFRHVPVVQDGRLVGVVSIGDVVKHRLADIETEHQAMREYIASA